VLGFYDSWEKGVDDVPREVDSLVFFGIGMNRASDSLFDILSKPWVPHQEIIPKYQFSMSIVKRNTYQLSSSKEFRLPRKILMVPSPFVMHALIVSCVEYMTAKERKSIK
jgi:hypothetical protein